MNSDGADNGSMFRILLVEDDAHVSTALTELLGTLPEVEVAACATSEGSALDWLMENRLRWDLAIVDLALGVGSGLRVLSACRVRQPHQKMVVLSNHLNQEMRRRCTTLGADAAFEKASDIEAVLDYCRVASVAAARRH
jgi:two-component system OmpR family response regulator